MAGAPSFNPVLTKRQTQALESSANEILYGGAAGGGKSYFMRVFAIILCMMIPGLNVYLFRREFDDLIKNHIEGPDGFPAMLVGMMSSGHVKIVKEQIRFWNKSKIFLCHCQHEKDKYGYQGSQIHVLLIDELTLFTEGIYKYLRSRVRAPGLNIPDYAVEYFQKSFGVDLRAKLPLILCGSNPGNIGHLWVKSTWIDLLKPLEIRRMPKSDGGMLRQYIPAKLEDNPHIDIEDYEGKLEGMGSKEQVKAMRHGVWDVVAGAYFDNWESNKHVIKRFTPPSHWTRFRSMDWGSYRPFCVLWWVLAEAEWITLPDGTEWMPPAGALIAYREWYGCVVGEDGRAQANVGLKLTAEAVAKGIKDRERGENITESGSPADPSMWREDGGPSIMERMTLAAGIRFMQADNARVPGWLQMRARLDGEDSPMLYFMDNCTHSIRTIPALQHDATKVEDLDSSMEDHASDSVRYQCMARPWSRVKAQRKMSGPAPWTLDWVEQQDEAAKKRHN